MTKVQKETAEERREGRPRRHAGRIRNLIENSGGKRIDVATLRHKADEIESDFGDSSLHDALDLTEREIRRHNKAVLRNSKAPHPRIARQVEERAQETRRRTKELFKETKRVDDERKSAKSVQQPIRSPAAPDSRLGTGAGNPGAPAGRRARRNCRGY